MYTPPSVGGSRSAVAVLGYGHQPHHTTLPPLLILPMQPFDLLESNLIPQPTLMCILIRGHFFHSRNESEKRILQPFISRHMHSCLSPLSGNEQSSPDKVSHARCCKTALEFSHPYRSQASLGSIRLRLQPSHEILLL